MDRDARQRLGREREARTRDNVEHADVEFGETELRGRITLNARLENIAALVLEVMDVAHIAEHEGPGVAFADIFGPTRNDQPA